MSASLMWEPKRRKSQSLPDALKFVLRDKLGLTSERRTFGHEQLPYLAGLRDANVEGTAELIEIIEKHEEVELWLEY